MRVDDFRARPRCLEVNYVWMTCSDSLRNHGLWQGSLRIAFQLHTSPSTIVDMLLICSRGVGPGVSNYPAYGHARLSGRPEEEVKPPMGLPSDRSIKAPSGAARSGSTEPQAIGLQRLAPSFSRCRQGSWEPGSLNSRLTLWSPLTKCLPLGGTLALGLKGERAEA